MRYVCSVGPDCAVPPSMCDLWILQKCYRPLSSSSVAAAAKKNVTGSMRMNSRANLRPAYSLLQISWGPKIPLDPLAICSGPPCLIVFGVFVTKTNTLLSYQSYWQQNLTTLWAITVKIWLSSLFCYHKKMFFFSHHNRHRPHCHPETHMISPAQASICVINEFWKNPPRTKLQFSPSLFMEELILDKNHQFSL